MQGTLVVAAIQLNSQDDVQSNLAICRQWVSEAARQGARVVVLPENFAYLGAEQGKRAIAERLGDSRAPIQRALAEMCRNTGVTLIAGGFPEASGDRDRPYNSCLVVSPDGTIAATYRKIHLFDVVLPDGQQILESTASSAGDEPVVVDVEGFRVGLSICYDLRFPELYRRLVAEGAELIVVPAAFTLQTGKDHWHVLLRARAIETQCWFVAAAQWGKHPKDRASYGHSLVVDPWGTVVCECSDRVGMVLASLDREYLTRVRTMLPSLTHRRL